jgi:PAS domain S-box-containing protein
MLRESHEPDKMVLLVEDDEGTAVLERRALSRAGFVVRTVPRVCDALSLLEREPFWAVLLDYHLPDGDPWAIVEAAKTKTPPIPVIIVTAMGDERVAAEAIHRGVADYVRKSETFWEHLPGIVNRAGHLARAEERVHRTDALFRVIVNNTSDMIVVADPGGANRYISPGCRRLYGYEPEELLASPGLESIHPEDAERIARLMASVRYDGRFTAPYRCRRKDGSYLWVESTVNGLRDSSGQVNEIVRVTRDISERMHAEEAVRESATARDQRLLFEISERLNMLDDRESGLDYVVTSLGKHLGLSRCLISEVDLVNDRVILRCEYNREPRPAVGAHPLSSFSPLSRRELAAGRVVIIRDARTDPFTAERFEQVYAPNGLFAYVVVPLMRDEKWHGIVVAVRSRPHQWSVREIGLIEAVSERTWSWFERQRATAALRESEARNAAILQCAFDAIVSMNASGVITGFNSAAERMFGHSAKDVIGRNLGEVIVPPNLREQHRQGLARYAETGEAPLLGKVLELPALRADGTEFTAEVAIAQVEGQHPTLFTGFIRDITERKRSAEQFRLTLEAAPTAMVLADTGGRIVLVNAQVEKVFGYSRSELVGKTIEMLVPARFRECHREYRSAFSSEPTARPMGSGRDLYGRRKDGTEVPIEIGLNPIQTPEGHFVLSSVVDITERRHAEQERARLVTDLQRLAKELDARVAARTEQLAEVHDALAASEARYRALFDDSPISLLEEDFSDAVAYLRDLGEQGTEDLRARLLSDPYVVAVAAAKVKIIAVNQATLRTFEAAAEAELLGGLPHIFGQDSLSVFRDELVAFLDGKTSFETETITHTLKGRMNNSSVRLSVVAGHEQTWSRVVVSVFDITAHKEAEKNIRASLQEKEVLIKEVHHRVKNNLQVISSLLNLQAQHIADPVDRGLFAESQSRVQSIALVHEKLYQSPDLSQIHFEEYVQTLVSNLFHSLDAAERGVVAKVDAGGIRLPVDLAIPCGLIINELVTNSLKHAFPDGRSGCVEVLVRSSDQRRLELVVQDDGVGLPSGLEPGQTSKLGLDLVYTFADQLEATVDVRRSPGTAFSFVFSRR